MAVDEAPDHNMSVWDWSRGERGYKLLETKVSVKMTNCTFLRPRYQHFYDFTNQKMQSSLNREMY